MGLRIVGKNTYHDDTCVLEKLKKLAHQEVCQSGLDAREELFSEELSKLKGEIDRVVASTEFNGMRLSVSKNERSSFPSLTVKTLFLQGHPSSSLDLLTISHPFLPAHQQGFSFFPLSFFL